MTDDVSLLAGYLMKAKRILVFTGAGISTESGISDYRSKGGLWDRFQPVTIQEFLASEEKRKEYWRTKCDLYESFKTAKPNDGHKAVAELEQMGVLRGIITQNIDGLHEMAGNSHSLILELHGNNRETVCFSCGEISPWQDVYERLSQGEEAPLCKRCQGLLKPNTISFGQTLNPAILETAVTWAQDCDLLLALGSTLIVEPAASIPRLAKRYGAKLVIITLSPTPLDALANLKIEASIGQTMKHAMNGVQRQK